MKPGTSLAGVKVAASPGVWIIISKLQESLAKHSSVLHANAQPVILDPSRELQVVHVIDRSSCLTVKHSSSCFSALGPIVGCTLFKISEFATGVCS